MKNLRLVLIGIVLVIAIAGIAVMSQKNNKQENKATPQKTEQQIMIEDRKINVTLSGPETGTPVLLIHGAWGTAESDFAEFMTQLAQKGYRVIAPDLSGYGKSQPEVRRFTADYFRKDAADMAAVIRAISPDKPVIVMGYSDGGETGLILTATDPDLVAGSILWGTSGKITTELIDTFASLIPPPGDPLWDLAGDEGWKDWKDILVSRHGEASTASATMTYSGAVQAIYDKGGAIITHEELSGIKKPVYLVYGVKDEYNPVAEVETLGANIPKDFVTIRKIENSGHKLQAEQPEELEKTLKELAKKVK